MRRCVANMRLDACISAALVLCCVLRGQPCTAYDADTATAALRQLRRLQGSQPSTAQAAHERTAGVAQQLRQLAARATGGKSSKTGASGAPHRAASRKPDKPHGAHKHPQAASKPSAWPMSAPRKHAEQQTRPSRPPYSQRQPKPDAHVPPPAHRTTASFGTTPTNSTVIIKRACGAIVDSDDVKQEVQNRLLPTIGQIQQLGRVATVYINVYFSINHVGGVLLVASRVSRRVCLTNTATFCGPKDSCRPLRGTAHSSVGPA